MWRQHNGCLQHALDFTSAARSYWLSVFPPARDEILWLQVRAQEIPTVALRLPATQNLQDEAGNLEGAAAFAAFVAPAYRSRVVRANVAFQAVYDYVDSLSEQPDATCARDARCLHGALLAAIDPSAPDLDYYECHPHHDDGGYLEELIARCRGAIVGLPSYPLVARQIVENTRRIVEYQTKTNLIPTHGHGPLARWTGDETPAGADLRWWETGAACGSSLAVFALLAAAADPALSAESARTVESVYWPWAGALHSLLDSLVDRAQDTANTQHSLVSHYDSEAEMAMRLRAIAMQAARRARAVGSEHSLLLTGMASLYLAQAHAWRRGTRMSTRAVLDVLDLAAPTMLVMTARGCARRCPTAIRPTRRQRRGPAPVAVPVPARRAVPDPVPR